MKATKDYRSKWVVSLLGLAAAASVVSMSSCVPLAIGAAGGYVLNERGYKLQSPVTREKRSLESNYEPAYDAVSEEVASPVYTDY